MLMKHISEIPRRIEKRREDLPPDLCQAVMVLLEKDPAHRFQSAGELAGALRSGQVREYRTPESGSSAGAAAPGGSKADTHEVEYPDAILEYVPTPEEVQRWNAPNVLRFRGQVARFIPVNLVIFVFAMLTDSDWLFLSLCWSVYMAYRYANLWSEGHDWRDVFRQPRDRKFMEVASDFIDEVAALFDPVKRRELRENARRRKLARRAAVHMASGMAEVGGRRSGQGSNAASASGRDVLQRAGNDRDEIIRIIARLPRKEKAGMADFARTANALHDRITALARVAGAAGSSARGADEEIEREIRRLEAEANPLDGEKSEVRVRRLAFLKRQRRSLAESDDASTAAAQRMEDCAVALHNMRLDIVRLRAGTQSLGQVTLLAERAMTLAREVDGMLLAADEVSRIRSGGRV
jgi:serine/threonine-protein kinase